MSSEISSLLYSSDITMERMGRLAERSAYKNSDLVHLFNRQPMVPPIMYADDIDGTHTYKPVFGEAQDISNLRTERVARANPRLGRYSRLLGIPIAFLTGRSAVEEAATIHVDGEQIAKVDTFLENFPKPAVFAGSLGAERYVRQTNGLYIPDTEYKASLQEKTGYKREEIYSECVDFLHAAQVEGHKLVFQDRDREENVTAYNNGQVTWMNGKETKSTLTPQEFKISYHLDAAFAEATNCVNQLKSTLIGERQRKLQVILSHTKTLAEDLVRYNIDVVPQTKEEALADFMRDYGCLLISAGDSGNDIDMLLGDNNIVGIVVGGAKAELVEAVDQLPIVDWYGSLFVLQKQNKKLKVVYREQGDRVATESILEASKQLLHYRKEVEQVIRHAYAA